MGKVFIRTQEDDLIYMGHIEGKKKDYEGYVDTSQLASICFSTLPAYLRDESKRLVSNAKMVPVVHDFSLYE